MLGVQGVFRAHAFGSQSKAMRNAAAPVSKTACSGRVERILELIGLRSGFSV